MTSRVEAATELHRRVLQLLGERFLTTDRAPLEAYRDAFRRVLADDPHLARRYAGGARETHAYVDPAGRVRYENPDAVRDHREWDRLFQALVKRYCAEHGLSPDRVDDYLRAQRAVLAANPDLQAKRTYKHRR
jgi:hypothetical protein